MGQSFLTLGSEREPHPPRAEWFDILIFLVFQLPSLVWTFHHRATWKLQTLSLSREGAEPGDIDRHHIPRRRRTFQSLDSSMCRPAEPKVHSSECSPPAYAHLSCVMAVLVMILGGRRKTVTVLLFSVKTGSPSLVAAHAPCAVLTAHRQAGAALGQTPLTISLNLLQLWDQPL